MHTVFDCLVRLNIFILVCLLPFGETRPGLSLNVKETLKETLGNLLTKPPPIELPQLKLNEISIDCDWVTNLCDNLPGKCKVQSELAKKTKAALRRALSQSKKLGATAKGKTPDEIDAYFNKVQEAKIAEIARLTSPKLKQLIVPSDDGLWNGDQIASMDFLQRVIDSANRSDSDLSIPIRRKRATGISLDYYSGNKWPSLVVNFYIDPSTFSVAEATLIRAAVQSIQDQTCLSFVERLQTPYVEFLKTPFGTDDTTCGWADLGYSGDVNEAHINFASPFCAATRQGVVVHEVLHVLGLSHEHNRYDRDSYIKMNWNNIDPQSYDIYGHDDAYEYNPYCVGYDYLSVMHYSPYVASLDPNDPSKPAFTPVSSPDSYLPKIGKQNTLSSTDVQLIKRLYCGSPTCTDSSPYCGWTACGDCGTYASSCQKSCGKCNA